MAKKKRSFGSVFLGFIRGLITLALMLVLVVSVGSNVVFYSADSSPKIDFMNYHRTFFVNNNADLMNIDEGALVIADHTKAPEENKYVLCTIGNGYKTVLCLSSVTENENGTYSYNVLGDKENTDAVYSIPESKIHGIVEKKNDIAGEVIRFAHETRGIIALMVIPAVLLVILSITAIKIKRSRYDDDMLEAEIYIEELRKAKRNEEKRNEEKKAEENRKLMAQKAAEEAEAVFTAPEPVFRNEEYPVSEEPVVAEEPEQIPVQTVQSEPEPSPFAFEEYKRKSDEETEKPEAPQSAAESVPASETPAVTGTVNKYEFSNFQKEELQNIYNEQLNPSEPVFQEIPENARPSYRYDDPVQNFLSASEAKRTASETVETPAPAPAPVQKPAQAPVKKKAKPPVKKINADSIDDLIRILEEEKRKLD